MNSRQQTSSPLTATTATTTAAAAAAMMMVENNATATSTGGNGGNGGNGGGRRGDSSEMYDRQILEPTPVSDMIHQQHLLYQHQHQNQQQKLLMLQQQRQQLQLLNCGVHGGDGVYYNNNNNYSSNFGGTKRKRRFGAGDGCDDDDGRQQQQRGVGFVQEVLAHSNPRDIDEVDHSWYTKEQLAAFKEDRKGVIRALKKVNFDLNMIDTSVHQLRGLEAYLSISFNKLLQRKRGEAVRTVLNVQNYQRQNNYYDDEQIRNASCQVTEWSKHRGLTIGQQDAYFNGSTTTPTTTNTNTSSSIANNNYDTCSTTTTATTTTTNAAASDGGGGREQSYNIEQPTMVTPRTSPTITTPKTVSTTQTKTQSTPSPPRVSSSLTRRT